jgi:hypothetical protein
MKKLVLGGLFAAVALTSNAQIEQGKVLVDVYYGFPNFYTAVLKAANSNAVNSGSQLNITSKGIGPVGIRGEYMVTDRLGLGLDMHYQSSTFQYNSNGTDVNGNTVLYNYNFTTSKIVVMPSFKFHFLEEEKMDLYLQVAAGYGHRTFKTTSTNPDYINSPKISGLVPVSFRVACGYRYFFTENIGINLALGIGGPLISAGLALKF